MARFKTVTMFIIAVFFANVFLGFLLRALGANQSQNPLVQGLVANGQT